MPGVLPWAGVEAGLGSRSPGPCQGQVCQPAMPSLSLLCSGMIASHPLLGLQPGLSNMPSLTSNQEAPDGQKASMGEPAFHSSGPPNLEVPESERRLLHPSTPSRAAVPMPPPCGSGRRLTFRGFPRSLPRRPTLPGRVSRGAPRVPCSEPSPEHPATRPPHPPADLAASAVLLTVSSWLWLLRGASMAPGPCSCHTWSHRHAQVSLPPWALPLG